ncbi:MAG: PfkB family carbohydrate kinase [Chloroflexi bacterium]|nr:PfkB family carbohydrate kinase [Chloroflexota bacterium]MCL5074024.1 PfkB family carbohydrate kinase [Chloroflexota bacterium]
MSVLVIGSIALDDVETPFGKVDGALGGAASYFALAASLYTNVNLVGVVGTDFPQGYLDLLGQRRVDLKGLQLRPGKTFRWAARYDFPLDIAQTLDTQLNVFADFHPILPEDYRGSDFVFLANIDPVLQLEVLRQIKGARLTVMDTMNFWIERKRADLTTVIEAVDIVLMNEAEVRQYSGAYNVIAAARYILRLGPKAVIIKKGEHGCALFGDSVYFVAPAYPVEQVLDPTGAGDSFAGGLLGYLSTQQEITPEAIKRAVIHGSIVASYTVEDFGVRRLASLNQQQIAKRYDEIRQITYFAQI